MSHLNTECAGLTAWASFICTGLSIHLSPAFIKPACSRKCRRNRSLVHPEWHGSDSAHLLRSILNPEISASWLWINHFYLQQVAAVCHLGCSPLLSLNLLIVSLPSAPSSPPLPVYCVFFFFKSFSSGHNSERRHFRFVIDPCPRCHWESMKNAWGLLWSLGHSLGTEGNVYFSDEALRLRCYAHKGSAWRRIELHRI